jgi:hypothetical protein
VQLPLCQRCRRCCLAAWVQRHAAVQHGPWAPGTCGVQIVCKNKDVRQLPWCLQSALYFLLWRSAYWPGTTSCLPPIVPLACWQTLHVRWFMLCASFTVMMCCAAVLVSAPMATCMRQKWLKQWVLKFRMLCLHLQEHTTALQKTLSQCS